MCKDIVKVEKKVFEFYRRIVYGEDYKKDGVFDIANIEKWCFYAAWKAMSQHTLHWVNKNNQAIKIAEKNDILDKFFAGKWLNIKSNNEIKNLICDIYKYFDDKLKNGTSKVISFSYGQSQKLVNMFFKHLYTYKDYNKQISQFDFSVCDCPVDSITLERLKADLENVNQFDDANKINKSGSEVSYCGTTWSKMDKNLYKEIQALVDKVKGNKTRFDYEFGWE